MDSMSTDEGRAITDADRIRVLREELDRVCKKAKPDNWHDRAMEALRLVHFLATMRAGDRDPEAQAVADWTEGIARSVTGGMSTLMDAGRPEPRRYRRLRYRVVPDPESGKRKVLFGDTGREGSHGLPERP